jgi:2-(1,2-epoxy-1,2-dihydrophenyl)acetyl-CoA isomerase
MPTAKALALDLANGPTKTLGLIRRLAWASLDNTWAEQIQAEREAQKLTGRTEDFREGVQAFFQKRKAEFKGA